MTEAMLRERCRFWQALLRLQDWDVFVRLVDELPGSALGRCWWLDEKEIATIRILRPERCDPARVPEQDVEVTLVHELLHLHFAAFTAENNTPQATAQEVAINRCAQALVGLDRARRKRGRARRVGN
ncbi:MAG: hypothetical protein K2X35_09615 [Bryobacteraceae bacterium]|nr:hypothetical protein [Bryobacteraceae bacterium]